MLSAWFRGEPDNRKSHYYWGGWAESPPMLRTKAGACIARSLNWHRFSRGRVGGSRGGRRHWLGGWHPSTWEHSWLQFGPQQLQPCRPSGWPSCCGGFRVRMLSDGQSPRPGADTGCLGRASINRVIIVRPWPQVLPWGWWFELLHNWIATKKIPLQTTGFVGASISVGNCVPCTSLLLTLEPQFHLFLPSSPPPAQSVPLALPNNPPPLHSEVWVSALVSQWICERPWHLWISSWASHIVSWEPGQEGREALLGGVPSIWWC